MGPQCNYRLLEEVKPLEGDNCQSRDGTLAKGSESEMRESEKDRKKGENLVFGVIQMVL